jgi:chorismate mutase
MADEGVHSGIAAIRGRIDEIDCRVVGLLNERATLALQIRGDLLEPRPLQRRSAVR